MIFRSRLLRLVFAASAAALAAFVHSAEAQVVAKGGCAPDAIRYIVSKTTETTASTVFVTVPDTKLSFTQGGKNASCATVSFAAMVLAPAGTFLTVQAVIDSATVCEPGVFTLITGEDSLQNRAMNFICTGFAPGKHSVLMQYRSSNGGGVQIWDRTTTVQYVH